MMCWREFKTGLDCYTNDKGESDFMCPSCPKEFADLCHKQIPTPPEKAFQDRHNLNRWC